MKTKIEQRSIKKNPTNDERGTHSETYKYNRFTYTHAVHKICNIL